MKQLSQGPLKPGGTSVLSPALSSLTKDSQGARCFHLGRIGKTGSHVGQFVMV